MPNMEYTYSLFLKSQVSLSSGEENVPNIEYEIDIPQNKVTLSVRQENEPDLGYTYSLFLKIRFRSLLVRKMYPT